MRYLITGGSGLVGRHLIDSLLVDGHDVVNLSRSARTSNRKGLEQVQWDGKSIPDSVGKIDYVINLAGAGIAEKRWSEAYKKLLTESRVNSTRACAEFINRSEEKPKALISASGYNFYGSLFEGVADETFLHGAGFISKLCVRWEEAAKEAQTRVVLMRISLVLDDEDGPLAKMLTPYKFFVGGPLGSGKQGLPWIHIDDLVHAIRFVAENPGIRGPVNMAAPEQVSNRAFSAAVGAALGRPSWFRLPKWLLKTVFGEMSVVLWGGGLVDPTVLREHGFKWKFPKLKDALEDLLKR